MSKTITKFEEKVYSACRKIPRGRVSTYSEIARVIGKPKGARAVGNALNKNPFAPVSTRGDIRSSTRGGPKVPCHRVVRSDGMIGGFAGGPRKKASILKKEGIKVEKGRIADFEKSFFRIK